MNKPVPFALIFGIVGAPAYSLESVETINWRVRLGVNKFAFFFPMLTGPD